MLHEPQLEQISEEDAAGAIDAGQEKHKADEASRHDVRYAAARIIEQVWYEAETRTRQETMAARPNWGERSLYENERNAIDAMLNYQAENMRLSAFKVETEMLRVFGATTLDALKAWNFDEIIRYLTDLDSEVERDDGGELVGGTSLR